MKKITDLTNRVSQHTTALAHRLANPPAGGARERLHLSKRRRDTTQLTDLGGEPRTSTGSLPRRTATVASRPSLHATQASDLSPAAQEYGFEVSESEGLSPEEVACKESWKAVAESSENPTYWEAVDKVETWLYEKKPDAELTLKTLQLEHVAILPAQAKKINLSMNLLTRIPDGIPEDLLRLDLSGNRITDLSEQDIQRLLALPVEARINLHGNELAPSTIDRLKEIHAAGHPPRPLIFFDGAEMPALIGEPAEATGDGTYLAEQSERVRAAGAESYRRLRQGHGTTSDGKVKIQNEGLNILEKVEVDRDWMAGNMPAGLPPMDPALIAETAAHAAQNNFVTKDMNVAAVHGKGAARGRPGTTPAIARGLMHSGEFGLHPDPASIEMDPFASCTSELLPGNRFLPSKRRDKQASVEVVTLFQQDLGNLGVQATLKQADALLADYQSDSEDDFKDSDSEGDASR